METKQVVGQLSVQQVPFETYVRLNHIYKPISLRSSGVEDAVFALDILSRLNNSPAAKLH